MTKVPFRMAFEDDIRALEATVASVVPDITAWAVQDLRVKKGPTSSSPIACGAGLAHHPLIVEGLPLS